MSSPNQVRKYTRTRNRKQVLDVDLNTLPPCESQDQEGTSFCNSSQDAQAAPEGGTTLPAAIDVEAFDDDVIISSPSAFAQAKNNSRRNRECAVVVDVDSEESPSRCMRRRGAQTNQTVINCDLYINLEGSSNSMSKGGATILPPHPAPPQKEPTFSCPVCMSTVVEATSTKCGHIFCKACIKAAVSAQSKCPTCRKKTTAKDLIRIYLPATSA